MPQPCVGGDRGRVLAANALLRSARHLQLRRPHLLAQGSPDLALRLDAIVADAEALQLRAEGARIAAVEKRVGQLRTVHMQP